MSYSIKELEQLSGIKAHTIRAWEQRFNILQPKRTESNIRFYDDQDLKMVLNISLLNENGYRISQIAKMDPSEMHQTVIQLTAANYKFPDQVQALTLAMIDMDEERFDKIMSTNLIHYGFENTMKNIVFPFLTRIGFLWQTGSVNPAQEHFITFLIRQKLVVAIDGAVRKTIQQPKKFVLYLPEGELHELTLLFAHYLVKVRGHRVINLGQNLPFEDAKQAVQMFKPDVVFCIITSSPGPSEIQQYINDLTEAFSGTPTWLTGYQIVGQGIETADSQIIIMNTDDLLAHIEAITEEN